MGGGKRAHGRPGSNLGAALKSARDKKNAGARQVHDKDHGEHLHVSEVHQVRFRKILGVSEVFRLKIGFTGYTLSITRVSLVYN